MSIRIGFVTKWSLGLIGFIAALTVAEIWTLQAVADALGPDATTHAIVEHIRSAPYGQHDI